MRVLPPLVTAVSASCNVQNASSTLPRWSLPVQLPFLLSTYSTSDTGAQLPSALHSLLWQSSEVRQEVQALLRQVGLRRSRLAQSLLVTQATQLPCGPQRGVDGRPFLQAVSSAPIVQARHDRVAASQIGELSSRQLATVRQLPLLSVVLVHAVSQATGNSTKAKPRSVRFES